MFSGFSWVHNYLQICNLTCTYLWYNIKVLAAEARKMEGVQSTRLSSLKDVLNCTCLEGSLVMLCYQGTWLFHMLKIKRKGWFREPLGVIFGQLSIQWECFVKHLCLQSCSAEVGENFS